MKIRSQCLLMLLGGFGAAQAEERFVAMDRMGPASFAGVRGDMTRLRGADEDLARLEIYGQLENRGLGLYGSIPTAFVIPDVGENNAALGNIEVGGFLMNRGMVLRVGVALPTATADDNNGPVLAKNIWPRLTDQVQMLPDVTAIRMSLSPSAGDGLWFFRADMGIDITLPDNGAQQWDTLYRANLGIGLELSGITLTAEMINASSTTYFGGEDRFRHTAAFSARHGMLYAGYAVPLDDSVDVITLTIGVERAL